MTILCSIWAYAYMFYAMLVKPYSSEEIEYVGGSQWLARQASTRQAVRESCRTSRFDNSRWVPIASASQSYSEFSDFDDDDFPVTNISTVPTIDIPEVRINPATGLVMMGALDAAGNIYGSDGNNSMCHNGLSYLSSDCGFGIDDTNDIGSIGSFENDILSAIDDDLY